MDLTTKLVLAVLTSLPNAFAMQTSTHSCPNPVTISDEEFVPGQVWAYKTRPSEMGSTVTILKIESVSGREVVHVRLDGLHIRSCEGAPELTLLQHAPFDKGALERSVTKLVRVGDVPQFQDGYNDWRTHCGGVYTITLAEMIGVDERTWNNGRTCQVQSPA